LILEAQKERYQKLEESLLQDRQDLEAQVNRELARIQQEIIECREEKKMVEERTEKRLQIEFEKVIYMFCFRLICYIFISFYP
jgi:predicted  nucleic acid-binding Zn-ribbon protein